MMSNPVKGQISTPRIREADVRLTQQNRRQPVGRQRVLAVLLAATAVNPGKQEKALTKA